MMHQRTSGSINNVHYSFNISAWYNIGKPYSVTKMGELLSDKYILDDSDINERAFRIETFSRQDGLTIYSTPTPSTLAKFSLIVYKSASQIKNEKLLDGWELLFTAENKRNFNGYFGAAFWNAKYRQVVVAHRGTNPVKAGPVFTDIIGIFLNRHVPQINSACTFVERVRRIIVHLKDKFGVDIQLFITGHSLGGWLSQITTLTAEYLKIDETCKERFSKNPDETKGIHAHTLVFDSPGCWPTLKKLKDRFDFRYGNVCSSNDYRQIKLGELDVTSYLSSPNLINTRNRHVGLIVRVFVDIHKSSLIPYTLESHDIGKLAKGLERIESKGDWNNLKFCLEWPKNLNEQSMYFKIAKAKNNFNLDETDQNDSKILPYCTIPFDPNVCSINALSHSEKLFLFEYQLLRGKFGNDVCLNALEPKDQKNGLKELQPCKHTDVFLHFTSRKNMQEFVPFIFHLLKRKPDILEIITREIQIQFKQPQGKHYISLYESETRLYLGKWLPSTLAFKKSNIFSFYEFLDTNRFEILLLEIDGNIKLEVFKIFRYFETLKKSIKKWADDGNCTVLDLERLISIFQKVGLKSIGSTNHSFILACKSNELILPLFSKFLHDCGHMKNIKIILVGEPAHLQLVKENFWSSATKEYDGSIFRTAKVNFGWSNLAENYQKYILDTRIAIQGNLCSISNILNYRNIEHVSEDCTYLSIIFSNKVLNEILHSSCCSEINSDIEQLKHLDIERFIVKNEFLISPNVVDNLLTKCGRGELCLAFSGYYVKDVKSAIKAINHFLTADYGTEDHKALSEKTVSVYPDLSKDIIFLSNMDDDANFLAFREICSKGKTSRALWVNTQDSKFLLKQNYDKDYLIQRELQVPLGIFLVKDVQHLLAGSETFNFIVIGGICYKELQLFEPLKGNEDCSLEKIISELLGMDKNEYECMLNNIQTGKLFLGASEEESVRKYKELCRQFPKEVVHYFKIVDRRKVVDAHHLQWQNSQGSIKMLRKYIDNNVLTYTAMKQDEYFQKEYKTVILSGESGIGKSSLISMMVNKPSEHNWVVYANLRECSLAIQSLNLDRLCKEPENYSSTGVDEVVKFLWSATSYGLHNQTRQEIFKCCLQHSNSYRPIIFFDSFDEIYENIPESISMKKKVVELLKFLTEATRARVFIATRESYTLLLENNLKVFASKFSPLSFDQQTQFLQRFWVQNAEMKVAGVFDFNDHKFATALLHKAEAIVGNTSHFMKVPLQLRLVAEVFQADFENYAAGFIDLENAFDNFTLLSLYERYVSEKYAIYFNEKLHLSSIGDFDLEKEVVISFYNKSYEVLSFNTMFVDNGVLENLQTKAYPQNHLSKIGLVHRSSEGKMEFIHETFSDYFLSKFIIRWLQKRSVRYNENILPLKNMLLSHIFVHSNFQTTRIFLNILFNDEAYRSDVLFHLALKENTNVSDCGILKSLTSQIRTNSLQIACIESNGNIVKLLVESLEESPHLQKQLILTTDENGNSCLHFACQSGDIEIVRYLITRGANVSVTNNSKQTPLHFATKSTNLECVQLILEEKEAIVSIADENNWTALHFASESGNFEIVKCLIEIYSVPIDPRTKHFETPLHIAAYSGHMSIIKFLVVKGAKIDALTANRQTALHFAAQKGDIEVINFLLGKGLCFMSPDDDNWTALHFVTKIGHLGAVKHLLKHLSSYSDGQKRGIVLVDAILTKRGENLLHVASYHGQEEMVRYLLEECKINLYAKTSNKLNALHMASQNGQLAIIKLLIEKGIDIKQKDGDGWTPLHYVSKLTFNKEAIKFLLGKGADIEEITSRLETPFLVACYHGQMPTIRYFLDCGADILAKTSGNCNGLHMASQKGHLEIMKLLVDGGLNIQDKDDDGWTPLHYVCRLPLNRDTINYFRAKGANFEEETKSNETPLFVALYWEQSETVWYLLNVLKICMDAKSSREFGDKIEIIQATNY